MSSESIVGAIVGGACRYCPDGELTRAEYKGNDAVVCETCQTPQLQVFSHA